MVDISLHDDQVRFEVEGWDKLWAFKSHLEIPLAHVLSVRADPEAAAGWWHGLKVPGTNIPGLITAGTFYGSDGTAFYDVHDPQRTIVVELDHEHYRRLVIEVADPEAVVATLRRALAARAGRGGS